MADSRFVRSSQRKPHPPVGNPLSSSSDARPPRRQGHRPPSCFALCHSCCCHSVRVVRIHTGGGFSSLRSIPTPSRMATSAMRMRGGGGGRSAAGHRGAAPAPAASASICVTAAAAAGAGAPAHGPRTCAAPAAAASPSSS
eukprot:146520-Chlamydomonas_euryale.AAC.6